MKKAGEPDLGFYKDKRVFVTGHTGFKGAWLTQVLYILGAKVRGYALAPDEGSLFERAGCADLIEYTEGDVRDKNRLDSALCEFKPEIVLHLAARAIVKDCYDDPVKAYETNVMGTVNLFEAIRRCDSVKSAVVVTTDKVYDNKGDGAVYKENDPLGGIDPYSASKASMEQIASVYRHSYLQTKDRMVGIATVRASNVIGGGDHITSRLIPSMLSGFASGNPVELRNPDQIRPWQSVLDCLNGYLTVAGKLYEEPLKYSEAWNIGPGKEGICTVAEVFERLRKFFDSDEAYVVAPRYSVKESKTLGLDISKSVERLGWSPKQPLDKILYQLTDFFIRGERGEPESRICAKQIREFFGMNEVNS